MIGSRLSKRLFGWIEWPETAAHSPETRRPGPEAHAIVLDGTMSSLDPGEETHAGTTYRLLSKRGPAVSLYCEVGIQWQSWQTTQEVMIGREINRRIRRTCGYLASRYRLGDRISLMGYSRGAYAVLSLAGAIDMVGPLRTDHATVRNIRTAYRHYECTPNSTAAKAFRGAFCHDRVAIEMIGVWDSVKALGLRLHLIWRFFEARHAFHNRYLGPVVRNRFHALALNETRMVYEPLMWNNPNGWHAPRGTSLIPRQSRRCGRATQRVRSGPALGRHLAGPDVGPGD